MSLWTPELQRGRHFGLPAPKPSRHACGSVFQMSGSPNSWSIAYPLRPAGAPQGVPWLADNQLTDHSALAWALFSPRPPSCGALWWGSGNRPHCFHNFWAQLFCFSPLTCTISLPSQAPIGGGSGHQLVTPTQSVPLLHSDQGLPVSKYWEVPSLRPVPCDTGTFWSLGKTRWAGLARGAGF